LEPGTRLPGLHGVHHLDPITAHDVLSPQQAGPIAGLTRAARLRGDRTGEVSRFDGPRLVVRTGAAGTWLVELVHDMHAEVVP
jgi:hypothetical protein